MACRAEWEEFGKAGLGRKAGKHGRDTKGKKRHKRNGRTGHSTGQDMTREELERLVGEGRLGIPVHSKAEQDRVKIRARIFKF